jgi:hypothetical protein
MTTSENERQDAARLGGALFIAGLYAAQAAYLKTFEDLTACAVQGALRSLLSMELGDRAPAAACAILTAGRSRVSLEGDTVHAKNMRVLFALLERVDWSAQKPLTSAFVITTAGQGDYVIWLDNAEGPLHREHVEGETPAACATRLRCETLGIISEVVTA